MFWPQFPQVLSRAVVFVLWVKLCCPWQERLLYASWSQSPALPPDALVTRGEKREKLIFLTHLDPILLTPL